MSEAAVPAPDDEPAYPRELREAEEQLILQRRVAAGITGSSSEQPTIGIAISGGGIRSAIFSLGVFQGLAGADKLKDVDYLSTVSGGSYFGAFLGAMFARGNDQATVRQLLRGLASRYDIDPVAWLRQNGRYLAPRGGTDAFRIFAILLRNWIAWMLIVFSVVLTACLALQLVGRGMAGFSLPAVLNLPTDAAAWLGRLRQDSVWLPVALPSLAFTLLCGLLYWFAGVLSGSLTAYDIRQMRQALTTGLTRGLLVTLWILGWAAADWLARDLLQRLAAGSTPVNALSAVGSAVLAAGAVSLLRKLLALPGVGSAVSSLFWSALRARLPLLAWPVALALWGGLLVAADMAALKICALDAAGSWRIAPGVLAGLLLFQALLAMTPYFLNRSSQHAFYAERLVRTFVGASNPQRYPQANQGMPTRNAYVSEPIKGDSLEFEDYHGAVIRHGGPLHLINATINETVSPYAATVLRDRKGLSLAIGPCGVSAGVVHHALDDSTLGDPRSGPYWHLRPLLPHSPGSHFSMFGTTPFRAEKLSLGYWTAISGAAVSTGLGSYGGMALSLLVAFANLRLGYWWNAGVVGVQSKAPPNAFEWCTGAQPGLHMPMQAYLLAECSGRFSGPHRGRWYLSDGGHSENTGALELIRRRVGEIVIIDAEDSIEVPTGNLGALARKARQDYGAELHLDDETIVPFGDYLTLKPGTDGLGPACAVRGRVDYHDRDGNICATSKLLYIRPVLSPEDAPDLLRYRMDKPDFPYQSTGDQFFNEAQWESYRKLGERIGRSVFGEP